MPRVTRIRPQNYAPRLFRIELAASYVGMGRTKFLELVKNGRMPRPIHLDGIRVWDRQALDAAVDDLAAADDGGDGAARPNSFDQVLGQ